MSAVIPIDRAQQKALERAPALAEITPHEWVWLFSKFPILAASGKPAEIRDLVALKRGLRAEFRSGRLNL